MKSLGDKTDSNGCTHSLGKLLLIVLADEGKPEEQFFKAIYLLQLLGDSK